MIVYRPFKLTLLALLSLAAWAGPTVPPVNTTVGSDIEVNFNGIGGNPVIEQTGLSSSVRFYNFTFTPGAMQTIGGNTYDFSGLTNVQFDMDITNTSVAPITASRVSGVGFLTTPDIVVSLNSTNKKKASINPNTVLDAFTNIQYGGNYPNGLGNVEFCFSDSNSNSCAGGGGGGVAMNSTGTASANLWFTGNTLTSLRFDQLFVRYQSVAGCATCGGSATGVPVLLNDDVVPEPSFYGILSIGMGGLLWFSYRRRQQA